MPDSAVVAGQGSREAERIVATENINGRFAISIDPDAISARLTLVESPQGEPVSIDDVLLAAKHLHLAADLDLQVIMDAFSAGGAEGVIIATGNAPVPGIDGRLESLVPSVKERRPRVTENGMTDFRDLGEIIVVRPGDELMKRIAPTPGLPGKNLFGDAIEAAAGKPAFFAESLAGALIDPEDPDILLAAIYGQPIQVENGIEVEPVFSVDEANLESGNICFQGTVKVRGDVQAGMTIRATGDIHVEGTVESAMLWAGGDIVIKGGIVGGTEIAPGIRPEISCRGSLYARFVQNGRVNAEAGIFIDEASMQSELSAGQQVIVGRDGCAKGHIIGGTTRAANLIQAQTIGAPSSLKTVVVAGAGKELEERLAEVRRARATWENKLSDIVKLLELAGQNPGRIDAASLAAAEKTRLAAIRELETIDETERQIERQLDQSLAATVVAKRSLMSGVELHFGAKRFALHEERGAGVFRFEHFI